MLFGEATLLVLPKQIEFSGLPERPFFQNIRVRHIIVLSAKIQQFGVGVVLTNCGTALP